MVGGNPSVGFKPSKYIWGKRSWWTSGTTTSGFLSGLFQRSLRSPRVPQSVSGNVPTVFYQSHIGSLSTSFSQPFNRSSFGYGESEISLLAYSPLISSNPLSPAPASRFHGLFNRSPPMPKYESNPTHRSFPRDRSFLLFSSIAASRATYPPPENPETRILSKLGVTQEGIEAKYRSDSR